MDEQKTEQFSREVFDLIQRYGIDVQRFNMNIFVSDAYFESIKANFTIRSQNFDYAVYANGDDWSLSFTYVPPMSIQWPKDDS